MREWKLPRREAEGATASVAQLTHHGRSYCLAHFKLVMRESVVLCQGQASLRCEIATCDERFQGT